ncbi:MAG: SAM hydrolase/SAM-dependent halogenase family protein [Methermicoccaceae archaeon]
MITLTTDFGTLYPAALKGAILRLNPRARMVDISHEVPMGNVVAGALFLRCAALWFPNAVHVCIMGSQLKERARVLAVRTHMGTLVGPDNGVLSPAARMLGGGETFELEREKLMEPAPSMVGSGTEYAVAAALIDGGTDPSVLGAPTSFSKEMELEHVDVDEGHVHTRVLYVDGFGNLILAIPNSMELSGRDGQVNGHPFTLTDAYVERMLSLYKGTLGFYELALGGGRAADMLGVSHGDEIDIWLLSEESAASP